MNWSQLQSIIWLRWRLSRNQFVRGGSLNAVLSIFLLVFMVVAGLGLGAGGVALGVLLGTKVQAQVLLFTWDGVAFVFLIFWFSGLMVEIQRSEVIDLTKLLHLPVTLQQIFVFNYVASHFTPVIAALVPGMLGLCVGLAAGAGARLLLLLPVVVSFVFVVTAWTYCLRGWLAALMSNKRRRRAVLVWVTLAFVLVGQLPNLLFNSSFFRNAASAQTSAGSHGPKGLPEIVQRAHLAVPPGWPGYAAMRLKEGSAGPALALAATGFVVGALGLVRSYQMTMRFYRGAERRAAVATGSRPSPAAPRGALLVERTLPWLADDTAALALATFRSLTRAPELKMALVMPVVMCVVLGGMRFNRGWPSQFANSEFMSFTATGVIVAAAFAIAPTMSNMFGLDRNGFRALVLLPMRREKVLLAKNLAFFPFAGGVTLIVLAMVQWLFAMPWEVFLVGLVQMPTAFLIFSPVCNFFSILIPYRLSEGTLKAQKPKAMVFVGAFGAMLVTPLMLVPITIPAALRVLFAHLHWLPWLPVDLVAALAIFGVALWLYRSVLPAQGRLLQKREQIILREVTAETE